MYFLILIYLMYRFPNKRRTDLPYDFIKWVSRITWTCFLPLLCNTIIVKVIKKNITNSDVEESINGASKNMMIYGELSEFEWRSEVTVYSRILASVLKNTGVEKLDKIVVPDLGDVVKALVIGNNFFCQMRQETKEEFLFRNAAAYIAEHEDTISDEDMARVKDVFAQQFVLILKNGRGDLFKEFYLGRSLMFLKMNRGNSKQKPQQKEMIPKGV